MSLPRFSFSKPSVSSYEYPLPQSQSSLQPETPSSPASTCGTMSELPEKRNRHTNTFLFHTYDILSDPKNQHIVCWSDRGDTFLVKNPEALANTILPVHFKHSNVTSFVRQLNIYGFHKIPSPDPNLWIFSHPKFRRDNREELGEIKRRVASEAVNRYKVAELSNEKTSLVITVRQLQEQVENLNTTVSQLQSELRQSRSSEEKLKSELSTLVQYISALSAESQTESKKRRLFSEPPGTEPSADSWDMPSFDRIRLDSTPVPTPDPIEWDFEPWGQKPNTTFNHYEVDNIFESDDGATDLFANLSRPLLGHEPECQPDGWEMPPGFDIDSSMGTGLGSNPSPIPSSSSSCKYSNSRSTERWNHNMDGCKPEPESHTPVCVTPSDIFGSSGCDGEAPFSLNPNAVESDTSVTVSPARFLPSLARIPEAAPFPAPSTPSSPPAATSATGSHINHTYNPAAMQQVHVLADQLIRALAQVCHAAATATAAAAAAASVVTAAPSRRLELSSRPVSPTPASWDPSSCIATA